MKSFGKTIKMFLIDGHSSNRLTCELSNWTGKAYKISRISIKDCADRDELNAPGVYILFGKDELHEHLAYIGESESVLSRLNQHLNEKDYWNEVILFISKDENLNKAHIKYLENRLYKLAKDRDRYIIKNSSVPATCAISESDQAEMEEFLQNIQVLTNALGHNIFEQSEKLVVKRSDIFGITMPDFKYVKAQGIPSSKGFLVFKGSILREDHVASLGQNYLKMKSKLIENKILIKIDKGYKLMKDQEFTSASTAAVLIKGRSSNGLDSWVLPDKTTLKQYQTKQKSTDE